MSSCNSFVSVCPFSVRGLVWADQSPNLETTLLGQTINHYKITAKLGEGGMGAVYQATDGRLGRQVALKILPERFVEDPQRMGRFQREAEVLASLNHPHISTIHGLEKSGNVRALVLELVEGPTLAERIAQGPIPVEEAHRLALEMPEALEVAHEKGIIHRDLKQDPNHPGSANLD